MMLYLLFWLIVGVDPDRLLRCFKKYVDDDSSMSKPIEISCVVFLFILGFPIDFAICKKPSSLGVYDVWGFAIMPIAIVFIFVATYFRKIWINKLTNVSITKEIENIRKGE